VLKLVSSLPLLLDRRRLILMAITMVTIVSQCLEPTLPTEVPALDNDKHLAATQDHQLVSLMCLPVQPPRMSVFATVVGVGSSRASTALCNKPKPICRMEAGATAEEGAIHAKPLAVLMLRS
jgi:hypothetical protein